MRIRNTSFWTSECDANATQLRFQLVWPPETSCNNKKSVKPTRQDRFRGLNIGLCCKFMEFNTSTHIVEQVSVLSTHKHAHCKYASCRPIKVPFRTSETCRKVRGSIESCVGRITRQLRASAVISRTIRSTQPTALIVWVTLLPTPADGISSGTCLAATP